MSRRAASSVNLRLKVQATSDQKPEATSRTAARAGDATRTGDQRPLECQSERAQPRPRCWSRISPPNAIATAAYLALLLQLHPQSLATKSPQTFSAREPVVWSAQVAPPGSAHEKWPPRSNASAKTDASSAAFESARLPPPELSFRSGAGVRARNSSVPPTAGGSQWIPIPSDGPRPPARPTRRSPSVPPPRALAPPPRPRAARPWAPPRASGAPMLAESSRNHQFYGPPLSHYHGRWRRPRFNPAAEEFGAKTHKYYKRVLLCDKTLVSLDYVRNVELEPRPFAGDTPLDDGDNFLDNFIDASHLVELASASPRAANLSGEDLAAENSISERRGYLSDEDPLVKCDMWDLEKGLKKRKPPEHILRMAERADFDTVRDAINRCRQLSERTLPAEDEYRDHGIELMSSEDLASLFSMKRGLIPGTKWCGLGDQASSYNDLGPKHRIDICCRAHDHCPIRLKPFRNDYGVLNIALYTKSHCDCDADFYRCLREVRSRTADMLGNLYFNVMKLQCMREERLKICREMKPLALGFERCLRYEDSPVKTVFKFTTPPVAY